MSIHIESHDIDLLKLEEEHLTDNQKDLLEEFVGSLQDAFHLANTENIPEELTFIAIEKTFKEYFDKTDIEIKPNWVKRLIIGEGR